MTEIKEVLGDAIAALPEREKLVVTLYYYEELTLREIGEVLGGDGVARLAAPHQGRSSPEGAARGLPAPHHGRGLELPFGRGLDGRGERDRGVSLRSTGRPHGARLTLPRQEGPPRHGYS